MLEIQDWISACCLTADEGLRRRSDKWSDTEVGEHLPQTESGEQKNLQHSCRGERIQYSNSFELPREVTNVGGAGIHRRKIPERNPPASTEGLTLIDNKVQVSIPTKHELRFAG